MATIFDVKNKIVLEYGTVCRRENLICIKIWGYAMRPFDMIMDVYMCNIYEIMRLKILKQSHAFNYPK